MHGRNSRARARRTSEGGFTLVEVTVVVAMVSILAVLATYSVRKYLASSKTTEAIEMIGTIKAAEEAYKDETFAYKDVTGGIDKFYPANTKPGRAKMAWGGSDATSQNFQAIGVSAASPVLFVYACAADSSGSFPTSPGSDITVGNWPGSMSAPWYVVKAKADLDGDGRFTVFVGASFTGDLFSANN